MAGLVTPGLVFGDRRIRDLAQLAALGLAGTCDSEDWIGTPKGFGIDSLETWPPRGALLAVGAAGATAGASAFFTSSSCCRIAAARSGCSRITLLR